MLKVGIVGCGSIGLIHGQAYKEHPEAELVSVCDLIKERANKVAQELGTKPYYSMEEMFQREKLDIVNICTQDDKHFEPTMLALENEVHVFCEKPLALSSKEAEAMVKKAAQKGRFLAVNFNRRFSPAYIKAKQTVERGEIGNLCYLIMKLSQGGSPDAAPYRYLFNLQVHSFDMLRYFGGEITELYCYLVKPRKGSAYTTCAIALKFQSECVGTLLGSNDTSFNHPIELFEAAGTKGYLVVDNIMEALRIYPHDRQEFVAWQPVVLQKRDFNITFAHHIHAFIEAVLKGEPPPITGLDGLRSVQLVEAAIKSFQEKRPVTPY